MSGKKKFPLHWRIIIFMILGILWGIYSSGQSWGKEFTEDFVHPFAEIFLRVLKLIAVPLVLTSLISGIGRLKDINKVVRLGGKTIGLFFFTALMSTTLGIVLVNISKPGEALPAKLREKLMTAYEAKTSVTIAKASNIKSTPLHVLVEMFPENIFAASSDNQKMIQVVLFSVVFGIALTKIDKDKSELAIQFFEALNDAFIKLVGMIMQVAPIGVFALMTVMVVEAGTDIADLLFSMLNYSLTIIIGLLIILFVFYPLLFTFIGRIKYGKFFKEMRPAFLLAFTTSSSNATLPVTMERVENHLGVSKEITQFVLPFGTTINMDGTALYQSIAAVFIAQSLGLHLSFLQMFVIVLTATVAAAGAAGVPSAGIVTLVIVLESINVPAQGIALILGPDRILDMCRTVVNVAGDAVAAVVISGTEDKKK